MCKILFMNELTKKVMADPIRDFHLPRYRELPDVGLYLEQTVQYVNQCIAPLDCGQITGSMVSNYVKKGVFAGPIKKQYYVEQIAHLMVIAIMKNVLSLENIHKLFCMQKGVYTDQVAYDYFCCELENMLLHIYGVKDAAEDIGSTVSDEKMMLRGVIISVCHMIHLNSCFRAVDLERENEKNSKEDMQC